MYCIVLPILNEACYSWYTPVFSLVLFDKQSMSHVKALACVLLECAIVTVPSAAPVLRSVPVSLAVRCPLHVRRRSPC